MKRTIFLLALWCMVLTGIQAQDVLQITPQPITPGNNKSTFDISMDNQNTFVALQFDLWVPEGINVVGLKLSTTRFPSVYDDWEETYTMNHTTTLVKQPEGQYRVTCYSTKTDNQIKGNSGTIITIRCTADANMPTGILPVRLTNVVLAIDGNHDVKPADNLSFLYTPDTDLSALESIDLTQQEGVTTQGEAEAARSLLANPNAMLYLNEGSQAEGVDNVVIGSQCESLVLTDRQDFQPAKTFTATTAKYQKTGLDGTGWYSCVLPYEFTIPEGVRVLNRAETDMTAMTITLQEADGIVEANTPFLYKKADGGEISFEGANAEISAVAKESGDLRGTYVLIPKGEATGNLILNIDGSAFGPATDNASIPAFRAYIPASAAGSALFSIVIDDETTGVAQIDGSMDLSALVDVYSLDGKLLRHGVRALTALQGLPSGTYIINGKKIKK